MRREPPPAQTQSLAASQDAAAAAAQVAPPEAAEKSVAVLPFVNMSSDVEQEYFADGLTEEILNSLAQLPELKVTARTSSFHFKGKNVPIPEIAKALGVAHVVEGSVRRSGERLKVTAQLIRAADGVHLWSQSYDRDAGDVFAVQEDVAARIATTLDVYLDDERREAMFAEGLRDAEAYEDYVRGLSLYSRAHGDPRNYELLWEANRHFDAVIARAPEFSRAYTLRSDAYYHAWLRHTSSPAGLDEGALADAYMDGLRRAAQTAKKDIDRIETQLAILWVGDDWRGVPALLDAVERRADEFDASYYVSMAFLRDTRRYAPVMRIGKKSVESDPFNPLAWQVYLAGAVGSGEPTEALATLAEHRRNPSFAEHFSVSDWESLALTRAGRFDEAEEAALRVQDAYRRNLSLMAATIARGDFSRGMEYGEQALAQSPDASMQRLGILAFLGRREEANAIAADYDKRGGFFVAELLSADQKLVHLGGHPFDTSVTPNLQQRLREAGLPLRQFERPAWLPPLPEDER
jgi:TolB-like protein